jgi:hypothetical protein
MIQINSKAAKQDQRNWVWRIACDLGWDAGALFCTRRKAIITDSRAAAN